MAAVQWACQQCDELVNVPYRPVCYWCGAPMIEGWKYRNPCSTGLASPMLAHIEAAYQGDLP